MRSSWSAPLVAAAALGAPFALRAQTTDGAPFEAGRWAIEVSSEQELGSLGLLRFSSPSSAWLVAAGVLVGSGEVTQDDPFGGSEEADISTAGFDLRLGYRRYQALGRGVLSHLGLGVLGQTATEEAEFADGSSAETKSTSYGVYGEVGGSYFFTPRFGLGASATAMLTKDHLEDDSFGSVEIDTFTFSMPQTRLLVTIVF